jgi:hypothetical protein
MGNSTCFATSADPSPHLRCGSLVALTRIRPLILQVGYFVQKNNCNLREMYTLDIILERLRLHKPELQRKYPISKMGVFGSYARGEATEKGSIKPAYLPFVEKDILYV